MSKPLAVAVVASVLLVGLLGADAAMNVSFELQQRVGGGWMTVAREPHVYDATRPEGPVPARSAAEGDDVRFRLLVENTRLWDFEERYRVFANGVEVADGVVVAPARGTSEVEFVVPANATGGAGKPVAAPAPEGAIRHVSVQVVVGTTSLWTDFSVEGGSA